MRRKENGGLGIRSMENTNLDFIAKLGRRLLIKRNELWAKVPSSKYMQCKVTPKKFLKKSKSSNAWHEIVAASNLLKKGLKAKVYNRKETLFWRVSS